MTKKLDRDKIIEKVKEAGIVGAGGAGFPTHAKMDCTVAILIINIAECEPLIHKDKEITRNFPQDIVQGVELLMKACGASQAFFAVKKKYTDISILLEKHMKKGMSLSPLEDYYPAGDELLLACDVTGTAIGEGELPISKGILVSNVETVFNISRAMDSRPVTEKYLTIAGSVSSPVTTNVPVGMEIKALLDQLKIKSRDQVLFMDGAMMGRMVDGTQPVTKTTSGILILPSSHPLVSKRSRSTEQDIRIVKSACDQCSYCTEYCPRYLIGHSVEPHRIMRSLSLIHQQGTLPPVAKGCVACSLCTLFACPEELSPDIIMREAKARQSISPTDTTRRIHPMREFRKVPSARLIRRLALASYDKPAPLRESVLKPKRIRLLLAQYAGSPARPLKGEGTAVRAGEAVAMPEKGEIGALIHSSITGAVTSVSETEMVIEKSS